MKRIFPHILLLVLLAVVGACSSDTSDDPTNADEQPVSLSLQLGSSFAANAQSTRADADPVTDRSLLDGEGIYSYVVVMTNSSGVVEHVFTGSDNNAEQTPINKGNTITTTTGRKVFYNFANLTQAQIEEAAGVTLTEGANVGTALANATFAISGNGFVPSKDKPIPMSACQPMTITESDNGVTKDLWTVRMLAKVQLQITNELSSALKLWKISLDRVTANPSGSEANVKLLPLTDIPTNYSGGTEAAQKPNLATSATTEAITLLPLKNGYTEKDALSLSPDGKKGEYFLNLPPGKKASTFTFYVNESTTPDNLFDQFILNLEVSKDGSADIIQQRYALISTNSSDGDADWDFIARNDWRIIPITLRDYALEIIPYDYPAIGVLPASFLEEDGVLTCTFHAGGMFHLVPQVKSLSDNSIVSSSLWSNGVTWTDVSVPDGLYTQNPIAELPNTTNPAWYAKSAYIHGEFAQGKTGTSTHTITVRWTNGGSVENVLRYPVKLIRED